MADVPLSFLSKLSESRDVMVAADKIATEKAQTSGTGMRNAPLAPRGNTTTMAESAVSARQKYQPAADIEYLNELPAHVSEQQMMQSYGQTQGAPRPAIAGPITDGLIDNSGLPDSVKQAWKDFPIETDSPVMPLSEAAMANVRTDLMNFDAPAPKPLEPRRAQVQPAPQPLNEQKKAPTTVKVGEGAIRKIVQEEMMAIMTKNIREQAIKDTLTTLMKAGIIPKK